MEHNVPERRIVKLKPNPDGVRRVTEDTPIYCKCIKSLSAGCGAEAPWNVQNSNEKAVFSTFSWDFYDDDKENS